jgi:hypothetical protein
VTVRIPDAAGKVSFERVGAVKRDPEEADAGKPGGPLVWEVRSGDGWPVAVDVELPLEYGIGAGRNCADGGTDSGPRNAMLPL